MNRTFSAAAALALPALLACSSTHANTAPAPTAAPSRAGAIPTLRSGGQPNVEFEMMTWPEVKAAIEAGKTTALFYTGGTEQRGPQNVNGGHTLMARETVRGIALRLGTGT